MENFVKMCAIAGLVVGATSTMASAQVLDTGNMTFSGTATETCVLSVTSNGTLTYANNKQFTTSVAGRGTVTALTSGGPKVSISTPTSWTTKPANFQGTTTFAVDAVQVGTGTVSDLSDIALPLGLTTLTVGLTADNTDVFAAGDYTATVVVTCE